MNRGILERSHIYQSISIYWEPQRNKARNFKHLVHQPATQPLSSVLHEPPHLKGLIISHMHYVLLSELNTVGSAHGVIVLIWKCLWLITSVYFPCWRSMELIPCSVLADLFQKNKKIKEPESVLSWAQSVKCLQGKHEAWILTQTTHVKDPACAGELNQWLRALVAFPEDPSSIPSTYVATHNHL